MEQASLFQTPPGPSSWWRPGQIRDGHWWAVERDWRFPTWARCHKWIAENQHRYPLRLHAIPEEQTGRPVTARSLHATI